jgi:hypothetical protein
LIAEPDPGSSGKIDPWLFSAEQFFFDSGIHTPRPAG